MKILTKFVTILVCSLGFVSQGMSWGLSDLDPINKNSGVRKGAKQLDPTRSPHYKRLRTNVQKTSFYVNNKCVRPLKVAIEFIPINSSSWKTNNYNIRPGENAYLIDSTNRNFYISATSPANSYRNGMTWKRKRVDAGNNKKYTYSFTCR